MDEIRRLFIIFILFFSLSSCRQADSEKKTSTLHEQGKRIYLANCIVCHNIDPTLPGSVGPEIAYSSIELISSKVLSGNYPAQYKPKRQSRLMVPLPLLEKDIPALHAYLNSFKKQ